MDASTAPAIGLSYQIDLSNGRQIVMQTHVAQDVANADLDKLLDRMGRSVERQRMHYENVAKKEALEKLLEQQLRQYNTFNADFMRLEEERELREQQFVATGRKGDYKAPANEEQNRRNARITLVKGKEDIDKTTREIEELKAVIKAFGED